MQDEDRLRDQVELALDNRQIFLFFIASAVVLSLVFAFGVVVGKRLSPVVSIQPQNDPLSMLDQAGALADDDNDQLSFPTALSAAPKKEENEKAKEASSEPLMPKAAKETPKEIHSKEKKEPIVEPKSKPSPLVPPLPKSDHVEKRFAKKNIVKNKLPIASIGHRQENSKEKTTKAKKLAKKVAPQGPHYTLQLSSFQNKSEAEAFMQKLSAKGHDPQMVRTVIPKRGIWYRVRVGNFGTWQEAVNAKVEYEKLTQSIAYVARL